MKYEISDFVFNSQRIKDVATYKDKIIVLCDSAKLQGNRFFYAHVYSFENNVWKKLPNICRKNGFLGEPLLVANNGKINFDSTGNIIISGMGIYKYDGNEWNMSYLNDEHYGIREILNLCIDKNGNYYFLTKMYLPKTDTQEFLGKSEFIKYSEGKYTTILQTKSVSSFYQENNYQNCIVALANNDILFHRWFDKLNEDEKDIDTNHNIFILHSDNSIDSLRLPTLSDVKIKNANKNILCIYPDSRGNVLFGSETKHVQYGVNDFGFGCCSGLSILTKDKQWLVLDSSYGYPFVDVNAPAYPYKIYENQNNYFMLTSNLVSKFDLNFNLKEKWSYPEAINNFTVYHAFKNDGLDTVIKEKLFNQVQTQGVIKNFAVAANLSIFNTDYSVIVSKECVVNQTKASIEDQNLFENKNWIEAISEVLKIKEESISDYEIYDLNGNLIQKANLESNEIHLNHLINGVYLIKLKNKETFKIKKFLKF